MQKAASTEGLVFVMQSISLFKQVSVERLFLSSKHTLSDAWSSLSAESSWRLSLPRSGWRRVSGKGWTISMIFILTANTICSVDCGMLDTIQLQYNTAKMYCICIWTALSGYTSYTTCRNFDPGTNKKLFFIHWGALGPYFLSLSTLTIVWLLDPYYSDRTNHEYRSGG